MGNLLACLGAAKRECSPDTAKPSPPGKKWYSRNRYKPVGESPTPRKLASLLAAGDSVAERGDAGGGATRGAAADVDLETEPRLEREPLHDDDAETFKISRPLISSSPKKKVTFDMNVTTFEHVITSGDTVTSMEETDELKLSTEQGEKTGKEEGCSRMPRPYPGNHRYQNCEEESDVEFSEADSIDYSGEEDDDIAFDFGTQSKVVSGRVQEESFDSYFSLQVEEEQQGSKEVSNVEVSSVPHSDQQATLVKDQILQNKNHTLTAADIQTPCKEAKGAGMAPMHVDKENRDITSDNKLFLTPEHSIHSVMSLDSAQNSYVTAKQEFSVDSSLSCWLTPAYANSTKGSEAKNCSPGNNSFGLDDRPILGALTIDDLKRTVSPSPRKSPRSPDETPIVGTVGSYWNPTNQEAESGLVRTASITKGIPNTTSKYREDKQVNWHSTPFEERLERALRKQTAGPWSDFSSTA